MSRPGNDHPDRSFQCRITTRGGCQYDYTANLLPFCQWVTDCSVGCMGACWGSPSADVRAPLTGSVRSYEV